VTDCVLDASALVLAVGGKRDDAAKLRSRLVGMRRHAPHLIDAEVGNVISRHEREGRLSGPEALAAPRAAGSGGALGASLSSSGFARRTGLEVAARPQLLRRAPCRAGDVARRDVAHRRPPTVCRARPALRGRAGPERTIPFELGCGRGCQHLLSLVTARPAVWWSSSPWVRSLPALRERRRGAPIPRRHDARGSSRWPGDRAFHSRALLPGYRPDRAPG